MEVFTGILLILIAILLYLDYRSLKKLSDSTLNRSRNLSDERYFELKLRLRMIEVIAAVLLFVGTFLGVFSINKIQENFKTDLNKKIEIQKAVVDSMDAKLARNEQALKYTPRIFVVKDIEFDQKKGRKTQIGEGLKFYYKDLKTIYGEPLPDFEVAPLINLQGDGAEFVVIKNTPEYFEISLYTMSGELDKEIFDLNIWLVSLNQ